MTGVDRFHIAHVLNHRSVTHSTVTAVYDRYCYDKEKRAALEKCAEVVSRIVEVKPAPTTAPAKREDRQTNVYEVSAYASRRALTGPRYEWNRHIPRKLAGCSLRRPLRARATRRTSDVCRMPLRVLPEEDEG